MHVIWKRWAHVCGMKLERGHAAYLIVFLSPLLTFELLHYCFPSPSPLQDVEQWVQNVLPSRGFGHIVLTTTFGIMDHDEARRKKTGGKILGFFY